MTSSSRADFRLALMLGLLALLTVVVFVLDVVTPLGVVVWAWYLPLILACMWFDRTGWVIIAATVCSLLVVLGYFLSSPGFIQWHWGVANRSLGLMALWLTAYAAISIGRRQQRLRQALEELKREVDQRRRAEDQLRELNETLELRVTERTAQQEQAQQQAQQELQRHQLTQVALQSSEGQLSAVVAAAVDAIISIDASGIIQSINPAGERLFGYAAQEVIGQNVKLLMPSPYREEHDGYIARYLETGEKRIIGIGREAMGQRQDGSVFPLDLSVAEAWLGDHRIFVGIIREITERKQAEEALTRGKQNLKQAVIELQEKNAEVRSMMQQLWQSAKLASVGELAASIAHELNNPLATMMLRLEALLEKFPEDDPNRRSLAILASESERMARLVANLLQFVRRGRDEVSTVDLRDELLQAVDLVSHHLRKYNIEIEQELADDTPSIFADRQKLRQVFMNLLTNASDAMPHGGRLKLRSGRISTANGDPAAIIEVIDNGIGISPENLDKVFDPFFSTKEEGKGTGLGLAICRRIVEELGGSIEIASQLNQGTVLRMVLPTRDESASGDRA